VADTTPIAPPPLRSRMRSPRLTSTVIRLSV
ncbi:MAG: hypothetical protein RJA29_1446, partial [Pseudomonadota bacterium]